MNTAELDKCRKRIDAIDDLIADLFQQRMSLAADVVRCKKMQGLPILNADRETAILDRVKTRVPEEFRDAAEELFTTLFRLSRERQSALLNAPFLKKTVALCGIKHCGKSTLGRQLADYFHAPFRDTDSMLEVISGQTVRELFRTLGETAFREFEATSVYKLLHGLRSPSVVAFGGGLPSNPFVPTADLKKIGFVIHLELDPHEAFRRVKANGLPPFLASSEDPETAFCAMCEERAASYRAVADRSFDAAKGIEPLIELVKEVCA